VQTELVRFTDCVDCKFDIIMRTGRALKRTVSLFATLLLAGTPWYPAAAQSYQTSTGSPSFTAPEPVELGFVDASNGNLHLGIPLGAYSQRGTSQPEAITLEYDSSIWVQSVQGGSLQWEPFNGPGYPSFANWYYSTQVSGVNAVSSVAQQCYTDITWTDQNGTAHLFHLNENTDNEAGCPSVADAFASDSSGYHMYVGGTNSGVYAPDGTLVYTGTMTDPQGRPIISKDSNGNYMSLLNSNPETIYDTLNRPIFSGCSVCGDTPTVSTSQGTAQYSLSTATINVKTNFQQSGVVETSTQVTVIRSITLPDTARSTYYFTYDCDSTTGNAACGSPGGQTAYYGELISITLPTGGVVNYTYTTFKDAYGNMSRWVSSRSSFGYWSYTPEVLTTCSPTQVNCHQQTTVATPTGQTIYTFQLNNGAWPITTVQEDLAGNLLSTSTNTWDFSQPCASINCYGNSFVRILSQQTTIPTSGGNLKKQTQYTYDSPQYGNITAAKEWKYIPSGNSFSSVPDRATYTSYLYTGTNNINRPLSVALCSNSGSDSACPGGGSRVSQTLYAYDSYGTNGLTGITGIAQHDDSNFGVAYTTRGNPTSISHWVSGTTYLATTYTYDTTGQVLTQTDPAGNVTTNHYSDNFFTDDGNNTTPVSYTPTQPTNAYLTSVTDSVGTQTTGYYWGNGKAAIATDYNLQSIYSHYQDNLGRQTEEIDPIGWKLGTYSSATQSDIYTAVADTSPSTGCVSCQHTEALLDSWGRTASQIIVNNPIGQVNVDNTYDSAGRVLTQSHPYSGSGDPNHVFETFGYDAIDRTISTAHPDGQTTYSNYGANVVSLGGVTAQNGSAATYGYGYPQIAQDEITKQRQEWIDGFGNIIETDEPSTSTSVAATATVSIAGGSGAEWQTFNPCEPNSSCPQTVPNSGIVSLTIDGYTASANYGQNGPPPSFTSASEIASALAAVFNGDPTSPVTASASSATILLTAKGPGASGDIAFSSSATYDSQSCPPYTSCFSGPAYAVSPSSGTLSGGAGGVGSSPYYTNYTYDVAGHLTQVIQGAQTRTFQYDGLGRKIYEATPEGGTVTYSYNTTGSSLCSGDPSNVCLRTDARGVVSAYTYDHANRLTGVAYTIPTGKNIAPMTSVCTTTPNGTSANVCDYYDQGGASAFAIGRLTELTDATGSESYSHDANGRMTQLSKVIDGQTFNIGYQYLSGGDVKQITYPSGRVVQQAYNNVGQLCEIAPTASGCSDSTYYAGGFSYNAPGNLLGFTYGNGIAAQFTYSPTRTQLTSLSYTKASTTYFSLQYSYQQSSPYSPSCTAGTTADNGAIECITDTEAPGRTSSYNYDPLGRMISEKTAGSSAFPQWGLSQSYDRYGNRLSQTVTAGSGPSTSLSFSTHNQPSGYTYDASGNLTVEPLSPPNDMTYDGENRMTAFSGGGGAASYSYDGNGLRVVKSVTGGTTTVSIYSGSSVIAEYDNGAAPSAPTREYVEGPTGLLALFSGGATTYYQQDHLSVRLTTDVNGNILTQEGHFPFGEQWYESGTANKWFFTSYDRDTESGLDYALARYYDSRTGTFCSADPLAGSPDDPQSWNRYPYGRNDPIDVTDPSGKGWLSYLLTGLGFAAGLFAPEIDAFLGLGDTAGDGVAAAQAQTAADIQSGAAIPSSTPGLFYRGAASAISAGGDAAGVSGGISGLGGAALTAAAAQATDRPKKAKPCPSGPANVSDYIHAHQADADALSKQSGVPADDLLGLSGWESQWGANRFAAQGNNFFSLHGGASAPFANGSMQALRPPFASLSTFPSYIASGQSFLSQYGNALSAATSPKAFAQQLVKNHFNSGNAATGGNSNFVANTVTGIGMVTRRKGC
jgi:RHS repeat-associated protein